ncbi:transcriptional regulator, ArsR family [Oceanobacillus limi]|uniref:Transcriptional regulator, ArsR family n=1 Tax=Oceanobacillus limi TaxID=930131 RepID=A0A1I0ESJ9_9BACI|nr:metalloregulator ArsR/SmtB family transcription factor [Oceanobacillus limi]SET47550.1 transcriptional regulator, ArsR family [Oceanobacillus limi]
MTRTTYNIYRALADSTRRKILQLLSSGEQTQSDIVKEFNISQPAINKQLRILKEEGFIHERKSGRYRYYQLDRETFEGAYHQMVDEIGAMLDQTLMDLKHYVENKEEDDD